MPNLSCLVSLSLALVAQGLEPLPIGLPKPLFEGTPVDVRVPNLEPPLGRPRPPFLAPPGVTNVAKGKPVAASDVYPLIGGLEQITDGDKDGRDGHWVELADGVQHVTIDLAARHEIYAVLVWHYHKQARVYRDVVIQLSDDPDFVTNVRTIFNNDHDNTAGLGIGTDRHYVETAEGRLVDAGGAEARYVRLFSNGSHTTPANHYVEVEVFGRPLAEETGALWNLRGDFGVLDSKRADVRPVA
jgi:hypothetical protein